jgi:predicted TIM-barrel fold metal-dependent hydrolase
MSAFPVIDCHTHAYPQEVADRPRAWAEARGEHHWADLVAPRGAQSIQGWSDRASMIAHMDAAGVHRAILLGWYWEREPTCRWHNEWIAEWVRAAPDRFIGFAAIHPSGDVVDQLETAKSLGLRGVGELHPGVQKFDAQSRGWKTLADWCTAEGWPVNLHVTETVGHDHPGRVPTPLDDFLRMAEGHPEVTLILAHFGGGLPFYEQNPKVRQRLGNVYYDCAAAPLLYDRGTLARILDVVGPGKVLFGSDYPLRLYPKTQSKPGMTRFLGEVRDALADASPEAQAAVLGATCRSLLGEQKAED